MSDHGDNFGDQDWYYHFSNVTDAGNRVPLFWLGHDHPEAKTLDQPVSSRFVYDSVMEAVGLDHSGPGLFDERATNLPLLESYWYNNQGDTLPKYIYNQFCFVEGKQRYLLRDGVWHHASRQEKGAEEPKFKPFENGADPVEDFVDDPDRRAYLRGAVRDFEDFSETIPRP